MLLFVVFLSFILSLVLGVSNYNRNRNAFFLAAFLCIVAIYNLTQYFVTFSFNIYWSAIFYAHFAPLYLLMGPMLYFFARGVITNRVGLQKKDWLHFIPTIVHLICLIGYYFFTPFETKMRIMEQMFGNIENFNQFKFTQIVPQSFFYVFRMVSLVVYMIANTLMLYESKYFAFSSAFKHSPETSQNNKKILEWLIISHLLIVVSIGAYHFFIVNFLLDPTYLFSNGAIVLMCIGAGAILLLNLSLFFYPEILYGVKLPNKEVDTKSNAVVAEKFESIMLEDQPSDREQLAVMAEKIESHFKNYKPYLNTNFTLSHLEAQMGIPQQEIRNCFQNYLQVSFTDYRMKCRVQFAKNLIIDPDGRNFSLDAIGMASGFGSKSNFFQAFKKETQMTPNQYLQTHIKSKKAAQNARR